MNLFFITDLIDYLIAAYAIDHNRQAMTAQNIVFPFRFKL